MAEDVHLSVVQCKANQRMRIVHILMSGTLPVASAKHIADPRRIKAPLLSSQVVFSVCCRMSAPQGSQPRDPPGLEWHVAVEHPAVLELHGLRSGGQVVGCRSRRVDLVAAVCERVPVEGVGGRVMVGQRVVVRRRERWPQCWLAVVVWGAWNGERKINHNCVGGIILFSISKRRLTRKKAPQNKKKPPATRKLRLCAFWMCSC